MNLHEILMAVKIAENSINPADFVQKNNIPSIMQNYGINSETQIEKMQEEIAENACILGYSRINLLQNKCVRRTVYGVTATVNEDGTITLNGTATRDIIMYNDIATGATSAETLPFVRHYRAGKYILSGGLGTRARLQYCRYNSGSDIAVLGYEGLITDDGAVPYNCIRLMITNGSTFNNETVSPMLAYSDTTVESYVPYTPNVAEYIANLEARITALETANQTAVNTIQEENK